MRPPVTTDLETGPAVHHARHIASTQCPGNSGRKVWSAVLGNAPGLTLRESIPGATEVDGGIFERAACAPVAAPVQLFGDTGGHHQSGRSGRTIGESRYDHSRHASNCALINELTIDAASGRRTALNSFELSSSMKYEIGCA